MIAAFFGGVKENSAGGTAASDSAEHLVSKSILTFWFCNTVMKDSGFLLFEV